MSVFAHRENAESFAFDSANETHLKFARRNAPGRFRLGAVALVKRAYPPVLGFLIFAFALLGILALRLQIWLPMYWN